MMSSPATLNGHHANGQPHNNVGAAAPPTSSLTVATSNGSDANAAVVSTGVAVAELSHSLQNMHDNLTARSGALCDYEHSVHEIPISEPADADARVAYYRKIEAKDLILEQVKAEFQDIRTEFQAQVRKLMAIVRLRAEILAAQRDLVSQQAKANAPSSLSVAAASGVAIASTEDMAKLHAKLEQLQVLFKNYHRQIADCEAVLRSRGIFSDEPQQHPPAPQPPPPSQPQPPPPQPYAHKQHQQLTDQPSQPPVPKSSGTALPPQRAPAQQRPAAQQHQRRGLAPAIGSTANGGMNSRYAQNHQQQQQQQKQWRKSVKAQRVKYKSRILDANDVIKALDADALQTDSDEPTDSNSIQVVTTVAPAPRTNAPLARASPAARPKQPLPSSASTDTIAPHLIHAAPPSHPAPPVPTSARLSSEHSASASSAETAPVVTATTASNNGSGKRRSGNDHTHAPFAEIANACTAIPSDHFRVAVSLPTSDGVGTLCYFQFHKSTTVDGLKHAVFAYKLPDLNPRLFNVGIDEQHIFAVEFSRVMSVIPDLETRECLTLSFFTKSFSQR
jgi:hypothetical protein